MQEDLPPKKASGRLQLSAISKVAGHKSLFHHACSYLVYTFWEMYTALICKLSVSQRRLNVCKYLCRYACICLSVYPLIFLSTDPSIFLSLSLICTSIYIPNGSLISSRREIFKFLAVLTELSLTVIVSCQSHLQRLFTFCLDETL